MKKGLSTGTPEIPSSTKKHFTAMASAYFLGTFNDNFFKQAVLILAVAAGRTEMQGYALSIFTVPFLLFAAPAGWLADRFAKRRVVIAAKWMELAAMTAGAIGLLTEHWILIFTMLFIMGTQATIFSPAINGSIPELFPREKVIKVNGILRLVVTTAILSGIALAGFALDIPGKGFHHLDNGKIAVTLTIIGIAFLGIVAAYGVFSKPASAPQAPFPWKGPIDTVRILFETRKDKLLAVAICADVFIWFTGSLQILLINPMGLNEFNFSKSMTSALIVSQLLGLGLGGILSARFAKGEHWYRVLFPAGFLMSLFLLTLPLVPKLSVNLLTPVLFILVATVGITGGLFMIPLESFIQVRPSADRKGTIWASANFIIFGGIMVSGPVSNFLNAHLLPTSSFGILGIMSFITSLIILVILKRRKLS
ncbi:MAG TPA: MFS transporter [Spirochaetota bacterium]